MPAYPPINLFFGLPQALWAFTLIIPLILLYLLKPKPKKIVFSSIMFIKHIEKSKRFHSAIKRFVTDPLLLIQILIIAFLILAISNPFYKTNEVVKNRESVILLLDASASMKANDVYPTRFDESVKAAQKVLGSLTEEDSVAIVISEKIPILAFKKGTPSQALTVLSKLRPSDSPGNLGDALYFSKDLLTEENASKKIFVFSDFSFQDGMDVEAAKSIAQREGTHVEFVSANKGHRNFAITSIIASRTPTDKTRVYLSFMVTNYGDGEELVKADVLLDNQTFDSIERKVPPHSSVLYTREFSVSWREHLITVELDESDDLTVDNKAMVYLPELRTLRLVLISNDFIGGDRFVRYALGSINNVRLFDSAPPVTPRTEDIDTVVVGNFEEDKVLPGTYADIEQVVLRGGALVVSPSMGLTRVTDPKFKKMLPITLSGVINRESEIIRKLNHEAIDEREVVFEETIVKRYYEACAKNDTVTLAETRDGNPLITYHTYGKGKVVYLGLSSDPEWSNFYYTASYPILWSRLIDWVNVPEGEVSISSYSAGDYMPKVKGKVLVTTPRGKKIQSSNILLDEVGVYYIEHESGVDTLTVNLENSRESNTSIILDVKNSVPAESFKIEEEEVEVDKKIYTWLAFAAILILVFEAFFLRRRGYYAS